jgi:hypothetical protein
VLRIHWISESTGTAAISFNHPYSTRGMTGC